MIVAVLIATGISLIYFFASRSLPDYNAQYRLDGISYPVEIVRDNADVPHIFGDTDEDVYFGLGFAHAQDRLWQMTVMRRTAQGRLSELFGPRMLEVDALMRRLDLYGAANESVAAQDAPTQAALEAYAAGVNTWIKAINVNALGRGAPEFFLFSPELAPWQPGDSLAILKLMSVQLSSHLQNEVLRARSALVLEPDRLADLLPDVPGPGIIDLPEFTALFPKLPYYAEASTPAPPPADPLSPLHSLQRAGASNAFAAAPARSAAGGTLLANDPHLGFSAPTIWYLARMDLTTGGVIGASIPGIPGILSGRSADLGWGVTASYMDDQDIFMEELNPANPEEYRSPTGWEPFTESGSIIRIKDEAPVTITLRTTANGPVLAGSEFTPGAIAEYGNHYNIGTVTPPGHVAALGWTALSRADTTMTAIHDLMAAKSVDAAIEAGKTFVAPSVNLTMVDHTDIAMQVLGSVPKRDPAHTSQGRLPSLGWDSRNRWQGVMPYDSNPRVVAPAGGVLGNTNNKTVDRPFPNHLSFSWGDSQRIQRWTSLMEERKVHTRESFIAAQLDAVSITARTLLPLIASDLWYTGEAAAEGTRERQRQRALELLANWNGEMNEHLPEPLIYAAWLRQLQIKLIQDDLGPLATEFTHMEPLFIERVFRDVDGASAWCDIRQSSITETCTDLARIALDEALLWIEGRYGPALESLRWGDAHPAEHKHPVLGDVPVLRYFVNMRQSTSGGDQTLQRGLTSGEMPDPFTNVHGAGYRGVYDFADPDSSVFITATGQSGHPLSRHYDDLGELWRRGEYIPMSLDPELARGGAVGVTWLIPKQ